MVKDALETGQFKFSVDSNLLVELGERLVTRPSLALAELVKNAYDADATKVTVTFDRVNNPEGMILIEDNGSGMTFEEIESNWMRIATNRKKESPVSRIYCRALSGAKGIGRLAARRLGTKLTLQSVAQRNENGLEIKESVVVDFNWEREFAPGQDLADVPVTYSRKNVPSDSRTGVALLIEGVRDTWKEDDIKNLRRDLLSIQSPYPEISLQTRRPLSEDCQPDPGFNFELIIDGTDALKEFSGELGNDFLKTAWAKLEGTIDENGHAHYSIDIQQGTKEQDKLTDSENVYKGLKDANFRIYIFVYRRDFFLNSDFRMQDVSKKGREEGGGSLSPFRKPPTGL